MACPLQPNVLQTYTYILPVSRSFPSVRERTYNFIYCFNVHFLICLSASLRREVEIECQSFQHVFPVPHPNLELSNEYGLTLFRINHALPFKTNKIVFIKSVKIMFTIAFIAIAYQLNWENELQKFCFVCFRDHVNVPGFSFGYLMLEIPKTINSTKMICTDVGMITIIEIKKISWRENLYSSLKWNLVQITNHRLVG